MYVGRLGLKRGFILASLRLGNFLQCAGFRCCGRCFAAAWPTSLFLASTCFWIILLSEAAPSLACGLRLCLLPTFLTGFILFLVLALLFCVKLVWMPLEICRYAFQAISSSKALCCDERSPKVCSLKLAPLSTDHVSNSLHHPEPSVLWYDSY